MIYFSYVFRDGKVLKFKSSFANLYASIIACSPHFTFVLRKRDRMIALLQSLKKLTQAAKQEQQCEFPCDTHNTTFK